MKTSRNDPCPCGSGKKYKACCMARDQARAHARSVLGEEAFDEAEAEWLAAARQAKEWAVDIAPAPGAIREDPDAGLSLVMVTADEWVAHVQVLAHRPAGVAERARDMLAAVEAAGRALGTFPEQLLVPDRELQPVLASALARRAITVEHGDSEDLWNAMNAALANLDRGPTRGRMTVALTWRETEATPQELSEFHAAAAEFYTAAPWAVSAEEESFLLDLPLYADQEEIRETLPGAPMRNEWAATVMGTLGESFGLMLHSQPDDLVNEYRTGDSPAGAEQGMGFTITVDFDHKRELTRTMQREIASARWPIAGLGAYPRLFGMGLPGRRVTARDVRLATRALRAITVFSRGGDPVAETGVGVKPFDATVDDDSRLDWFNSPEQASPVRAAGPGAATEPRLGTWEVTLEELESAKAAEQERIHRFGEWLREQGVPQEEAQVDLRNANAWTWTTIAVGSPAGVTELDLRLFLYDQYVRKTDPTPEAVAALPRSMRRIVRWLEEREGVRYPFAASVLNELERIAARARQMDEPLEDTLRILSYDVYEDLDVRVMLPASRGWPDLMSAEVAQLREELQRRWLLWYDELVRDGMTDFGELEDVLLARQCEWEAAPHPRVGGRTPLEVVVEYVSARG
ncbi:MAG TPA: SEC-C domain-containing protein [Longimicrobium sp.]|jgi:hypothetical protein|nr:SEC-C domain-containing protein [Longimicrobium sp.]